MEYEVRKLQENKEPFPNDTTHYSPILLFNVCFGLASLASDDATNACVHPCTHLYSHLTAVSRVLDMNKQSTVFTSPENDENGS